MQMNVFYILSCAICHLIALLSGKKTKGVRKVKRTMCPVASLCPDAGARAAPSILSDLIYNLWIPPGGTGADMRQLSAWLAMLSIQLEENLLWLSNVCNYDLLMKRLASEVNREINKVRFHRVMKTKWQSTFKYVIYIKFKINCFHINCFNFESK